MEKLKIAVPIVLVFVYTAVLLLASHQLKTTKLFSTSYPEYVNFQLNYQVVLLVITLLSLLSTYYLNKENFLRYFSFGNISFPAKEMKLFGIKANDSWLKTGLSLSLFISLATGIFMYNQMKAIQLNGTLLQNGILWIVLFSLSNSFGEEMIYRIGIVSPIAGLMAPMSIFIVSAILFGLPHLAGMPGGIIGVFMAGVLGLVLAKSLYETNGFFWAWLIHFLQDLIIIGTFFLVETKK